MQPFPEISFGYAISNPVLTTFLLSPIGFVAKSKQPVSDHFSDADFLVPENAPNESNLSSEKYCEYRSDLKSSFFLKLDSTRLAFSRILESWACMFPVFWKGVILERREHSSSRNSLTRENNVSPETKRFFEKASLVRRRQLSKMIVSFHTSLGRVCV